jgi:hypothetical protein
MAEIIPSLNINNDLHSYRRLVADRYYSIPLDGVALSVIALPLDTLVAMPFIVPKTITVDRIAVNITTGTALASDIRLGIYIDTLNLYPDGLVLDAGTVDASVAGGAGVKTITINQQLVKNTLYWLAMVASGTPTLRSAPISAILPILGYDSTLPTTPGTGYTTAFAFAPLPSTFPVGAGISASGIPLIFVRPSA